MLNCTKRKSDSMKEIEEQKIYARTELLIPDGGMEKLKKSKILIFGAGGVGGFAIEALARSGVGEIHVVDGDVVAESNLNRQIIADMDSIGKPKVECVRERVAKIAPFCQIECSEHFFLPGDDCIDFTLADYVIDAVDTVAAKIEIIRKSKEINKPIISCMGMGNKMDNGSIRIADISDTKVCPLAKVVRQRLRALGINDVKVCYSVEPPIKTGSRIVGSISYMPATAGLMIAGEVIRDILAC